MNTDNFGFSQAAFAGNAPGYGDSHPRRENVPNINTSRLNTLVTGDMPTPGTAFDMNYTPLLPSNLLIGSPLQPASPGFASPQFQSFPGVFGQQHNQPHRSISQQQPMITSQMYGGSVGAHNPYFAGAHSPTNTYGGYGNQGIGMVGGHNGQYGMPQNQMPSQSRTVYLGNIPPDTPAEEILSHVRSGQIESVRLLPDKNCAFISFLDSASATHFHSDAILKKLCIKGQDVKIGWGKPSSVPTSVALAVQQTGASRNVYLGNLPEETSEQELRDELGKFGPIDTIKIVREKAIGFVHFLSIGNAIKAVAQLPQEPRWQPPRRVYYGKDRCAYVSKTQQQNAAQYLGIAPGYAHVLNNVDRDLVATALAQQSVAAAAVASTAGGASNVGNRTVYLGNIHPETTIEEICNVVRGGLLHHIRYIPDKHICFVTFIDPTAAASFFALSNLQGLMIHNRRLKIGWGKHSGPLPAAISMAVSGGASRNVYVGNLDETWTEERLRQDFQEYGEIELVNTLREKSCAFVNFTNIANAIKAIEAVRGKDDYRRFKVNFGKDRCGNPPRQTLAAQQQEQAANATVNGLQNARGQHTGSPASVASGNANSMQGPTASTVMNAGAANPLTMYLVATQHQVAQAQQPQPGMAAELTPPTFSIGAHHSSHPSGQLSTEQAFYSNDNTTHGSLSGSTLDAPRGPSHYGHQPAHSMNLGMSNGFGNGVLAHQQPHQPGHRQTLSVGKSHARTVSLPSFTQVSAPGIAASSLPQTTQQPQTQTPAPQQQQQPAFAGLGAGLGNITTSTTGAPSTITAGGNANGHGLGVDQDAAAASLPGLLQETSI